MFLCLFYFFIDAFPKLRGYWEPICIQKCFHFFFSINSFLTIVGFDDNLYCFCGCKVICLLFPRVHPFFKKGILQPKQKMKLLHLRIIYSVVLIYLIFHIKKNTIPRAPTLPLLQHRCPDCFVMTVSGSLP